MWVSTSAPSMLHIFLQQNKRINATANSVSIAFLSFTELKMYDIGNNNINWSIRDTTVRKNPNSLRKEMHNIKTEKKMSGNQILFATLFLLLCHSLGLSWSIPVTCCFLIPCYQNRLSSSS